MLSGILLELQKVVLHIPIFTSIFEPFETHKLFMFASEFTRKTLLRRRKTRRKTSRCFYINHLERNIHAMSFFKWAVPFVRSLGASEFFDCVDTLIDVNVSGDVTATQLIYHFRGPWKPFIRHGSMPSSFVKWASTAVKW